ncbi:MAG TPA: GH116 family glycosyl hydrolase [Candidatus Hydrogenedentes bacterium]|nr:GH116 family glycosyl hydrolase [Candidatus Hydrogenedentota bacterium]
MSGCGKNSRCACENTTDKTTRHGLTRRQFIEIAGLTVLAAGSHRALMAGPFQADPDHPVPADKKLDPAWVRSLFERGEKEVFTGADLEPIGMPCGGIGSGQMYLCGDGRLGDWQIFNDAVSRWIGNTGSTYERRAPARPFFQEFALLYCHDGGEGQVRLLNREAWASVSFRGEFPIGTVTYRDPSMPVWVSLEAFTPWIPLNAEDSALPATIMEFTAHNDTEWPIEVSVAGLLENMVFHKSRHAVDGVRRTIRWVRTPERVLAVLGARTPTEEELAALPPPRENIVFADFEGSDYGAWTVEGEAFGQAPATGPAKNQQPVSGFEGKGFAGSYSGNDDLTGKLVSPEFTVSRRFISFLLGAGPHPERTEVRLIVDGEVARRAAGRPEEQLRWTSWDTRELEGKTARIEIVDDAKGGWGHINVDQIVFCDRPMDQEGMTPDQYPDWGSLCLAVEERDAAKPDTWMGKALRAASWPMPLNTGEGDEDYPDDEQRGVALAAPPVRLGPGNTYTFRFALTWHFPRKPSGKRNYYSVRFPDAEAVATYLLENYPRLAGDTRLWRDRLYDSTLPYWLIDRLHSTISYLGTGSMEWWHDGRIHGWEGVTCCHGNCSHVWNYAHGMARLFPELERRVREMQDFRSRDEGGGFHDDTGLVGFRGDDNYAADGQCGTVLKAYREHLMSRDRSFLQRNWPRIRKALRFSMTHDENGDGLIEDLQHNTFDINFFGANTFVGSLYLAALRAGEAMAREMGDLPFAEECARVYESGRKLTEERLWNGEYFIQDVDLSKHPQYQYADGCLSDQVFGQGWAHQVGLGYIYDPGKVRQALRSVWKYNWAPDVKAFNDKYPPFRWFITPGHAGLIVCTWPAGNHMKEGVLYREEVWTGIEYQVANHMANEGMLEEALVICRAVHDRYHPSLANPYNEVECGDHYVRALASWGVWLALGGFYCHGPEGILGFAPKMTPDRFRAVYTVPDAWITLEQVRENGEQRDTVACAWGETRLNRLRLELPEGKSLRSARVLMDGVEVEAEAKVTDRQVEMVFARSCELRRGNTLVATLALA